MIHVSAGLKNSLLVLEHLRNNEELNQLCDITVGTFTNNRECGLTFYLNGVTNDKGQYKSWVFGSRMNLGFTWCVYEHRNSDSIIINGKEGLVSANGDLPYIGESKSDYLAEYRYNQHLEVADKLAEFMMLRREQFLDQASDTDFSEPIKMYEVVINKPVTKKSKK